MTQRKTYKREVAAVLLLYYFGMLTASIWYPDASEAAESVKIPAFTFATGAFALDAASKQFSRGDDHLSRVRKGV